MFNVFIKISANSKLAPFISEPTYDLSPNVVRNRNQTVSTLQSLPSTSLNTDNETGNTEEPTNLSFKVVCPYNL